jgi:hypothetical protein
MPIYHFHLVDGRKLADPHGLELPDSDAAIRYAEGLAQSFGPVSRALNGEGVETYIDIIDESGDSLARVKVVDAR